MARISPPTVHTIDLEAATQQRTIKRSSSWDSFSTMGMDEKKSMPTITTPASVYAADVDPRGPPSTPHERLAAMDMMFGGAPSPKKSKKHLNRYVLFSLLSPRLETYSRVRFRI